MKDFSERTVINIVSGKGGTGKTLLACVLADMLGNAPNARVVVVDLDVFVRGLTSLLYFHRKERLSLANDDELVVGDFFGGKLTTLPEKSQLGIRPYRAFDVVPAVNRIDQLLNFRNLVPDTRDEAKAIVSNLLSQIPKYYRFVILDSRAGYDELIAATHNLSDVSVCVEEQDPISKITADNLIAQLQQDSTTPLFRLVNKAHNITSEDDLDREIRSVTDLGIIPFDMDVMNSFGSPYFWEAIFHSLYRVGAAKAWNRLADKLRLDVQLRAPRLSPLGSERLESIFGFLSWSQRVFLFYGGLIGIFGIGYGILGNQFFDMVKSDPYRFFSLLTGLMGLVFSLSVFMLPFRGREARSRKHRPAVR